ncbi:DUF4247 domain-containing protein [Nocardia sp. NPDC127526]|uniref:DUF4247 domain-containing protein n=1 Tax=Nocardia sp. NPDC127526 TaxID=3345393 RepID=UPI00363ABAC9
MVFVWVGLLVVAVLAFVGMVLLGVRRKRQGAVKGVGRCIAGALVALLVGVGAIAGMVNSLGDKDDPRPYIEKTYKRAAELDDKLGGKVYTATHAPAKVEKDISKKANPAAVYRDKDLTFLRYPAWLVVLSAHAGGTKIDVDGYDNGYKRYRDRLAGSNWPSTSSAASGNGGNNSGK